jgi:hypothetical protein
MGQMLEVYPFQRKRKYGAESEKRRFWNYIKVFMWEKK